MKCNVFELHKRVMGRVEVHVYIRLIINWPQSKTFICILIKAIQATNMIFITSEAEITEKIKKTIQRNNRGWNDHHMLIIIMLTNWPKWYVSDKEEKKKKNMSLYKWVKICGCKM